MKTLPERDWAQWSGTPIEGVSLLRAHFVAHQFERHSHDTFSIGVTFDGGQSFRCRGTMNTSHRGNVIVFNPDEAHDGHAEDERGFAYAMLYVPPQVIDDWLGGPGREDCGAYVRESLIDDVESAAALARAMQALQFPGESLRCATLMQESVLQLFERHAGARPMTPRDTPSAAWLRRVRDQIEADYASNLSVETLARTAGVSRVHLTRAFTAAHGVAPHMHLNAVRIAAAKRLLLSGSTLADTAAAAGFVDQSHFTRRFKGTMGVTPGAWARAMTR